MGTPTCHPEKKLVARGLCDTCYRRAYRAKNRERLLLQNRQAANRRYRENGRYLRDRQTARRYGLSYEEYVAKMEAAGGVCEVCGGSTKRMAVDHDHLTGQVRGVLCLNCNSALGHAQDDPTRLRLLADYLDRYR